MRKLWALCCLAVLLAGCDAHRDTIVIGSKNFTEQVVLSELLAQQIEARTHLRVERRFYLAGSYICHQALLAKRLDLYVEYTGTALTAILKEPPNGDSAQVFDRVQSEYERQFGLEVMPSLGFDNTFAMVIRGEDARRLQVKTLSQAAQFAPQWRLGIGYEFLERPDGYQGLVKTYGLKFASQPRVMDLGLLYRALQEKQVDMVAGNATDGVIGAMGAVILEDDKHYFPPYDAVPVVREETLRRHPEVRAALAELTGKVTPGDMRAMNYAVDAQHRDVKDVVREFRQRKGL